MHSLVRRFIKTAVGFLAIGLLLGLWMITQRELAARASSAYLVSAHTHAIVVGFVMMLIMGVALWLFPRPDRADPRYSPAAAAAAYWLVTVGTGARIAGEIARLASDALWLRAAIVACGAMQVAGILVFFWTMWSRIRAVGSQQREARGERF